MIPFGLVPAAAPQMAPPPDTPPAAGAFDETGAAFDAALSATLAVIEQECGDTAASKDMAAVVPEWLFPPALTLPVEQPAVPPAVDASIGLELPLDIDEDIESVAAAPEGEKAPGADALNTAVVLVVPDQLAAPAAVAPTAPVAVGDARVATPTLPSTPAVDQQIVPAAPKSERMGEAEPADVRPRTGSATALAAQVTREVVVTEPPKASVPQAATPARFVAVDTPREPLPGELPEMTGVPRTNTAHAVAAGRMRAADVQVAPAIEAPAAAPATTDVAPVPPDVIAAAVTAAPQLAGLATASALAETRQAADAQNPGAGLAIASDSASGQQAPMTGGEQFSNGGSRPSPEFMRFAAALAQVAPAAEEGSRTATQSVAPPVTATTAASPVNTTAPAAPVAPTAPAAPAETPDAENVGRLVQTMRVFARTGTWEATVRLKPEHFGDVTIALKVERNSVSAVVNAEAAGVRQWLESQEQAVRSGMAEHGLQLERFVVQRDGQRNDAQAQEQEPQRRQPKRQTQTTERFEIVV